MGLDEVAAVIDVSKKECAQKAVGVRVVVVLVVVGEVPRDIDERLGILRKRVDLDAKVRSQVVQVQLHSSYKRISMCLDFNGNG